ncbi:MAG TPA: exodeoxyribonuclease III, partial [Blastocatellia bacterium]|nr:exodeoxyribonuclease III [Blastocatellia bacterium]
MKIATWNVNSVTARLPLVLKWLASERPDLLCLQETKCIDERFPREAVAELGYDSVTFGQRTYNGVAILVRSSVGSIDPLAGVERGFPEDPPDAQARMLVAEVGGIHIINVYIPNGQAVGTDKYQFKLEWIERLRHFIDSRFKPDEKVFICGDFNVAPEEIDVHDPKFWRGRILFSKAEREAIDHVKRWGFVDAF